MDKIVDEPTCPNCKDIHILDKKYFEDYKKQRFWLYSCNHCQYTKLEDLKPYEGYENDS